MTCKYNYKNVSLKNSTYSELDECSRRLAPQGEHWSKANTIEHLIFFCKSLMPNKTRSTINDSTKDTTNSKI